jgi:hypothetical protein
MNEDLKNVFRRAGVSKLRYSRMSDVKQIEMGDTFPGINCPAIIIPSLGVSLTKLEGPAGCNRVPDRLKL